MTMDLHEKVEKENGLSEVVSADPQSDLDHRASCGEIDLLPPIKKIKSRKRKQKQQITVDSHERVENENDSSEGTPLVVDTKSLLADPRSDLDHEKAAQLCGETGALPPIEKIKSKKRKPKKQITTAVNPAETSTPVDQDLHVNMEKMTQKQNITEVVSPGSSNLLAEASLSALQDLNVREKARKRNWSQDSANVGNPDANNISAVAPTSDLQGNVSRKKKKRNRKGEQNSANLVNPETSNMSAAAPTSVLQRLNENIEPSDEYKGLILREKARKKNGSQDSANVGNPDANNISAVALTSDLQDNVSRKKKKRNRKGEQNSAMLVNLETGNMSAAAPTSVLQRLNENIESSDELKGLMLREKARKRNGSQDSANVGNPDANNMSAVAPTSDSQDNVSMKKKKRKRKGEQNSANLVNPETSNMSAAAPTSVLQRLNENIEPSDESKGLMLREKARKRSGSQDSVNVGNPDANNISAVAPASDLQDNVSRKKKKRNRKGEQESANLDNPETSNMSAEAPTSVFQRLNENIEPSDESKGLMLREKARKRNGSQDSANVGNPDANNISAVAPTSDLQDNVSRKKKKRNRKGEQNSANLVNPETSNMSAAAPTSVLQRLNENVEPSDESKGLMLREKARKRNESQDSANVGNSDVNISAVAPTSDLQDNVREKARKRNESQDSANVGNSDVNISAVAPTSDLQDNVSRKKKKRNRKGKQNSANLVNPETSNMSAAAPTSVLQRLNENIGPSDESKGWMLLKDDYLVHSSNLAIPEALNLPGVAPTLDLQEKEGGKKRKRNRERGQNSANLDNHEIDNMSTVGPTSVLQGLNENTDLSDESKVLMLPKDDCLMHSSNLVNLEASDIPGVGPTSDLQENVRGKRRKRNSKREQNSANLVNPEASSMSTVATVLQGLNGNIDPSDESKSLMLSKDDCLMHSSNLVIPEASNIPVVALTSDSQENESGKKRKRNRKRGQHSANVVNSETSNLSNVPPPLGLQEINGNTNPLDESQSLMLSKDKPLLPVNLVNPEASNMSSITPTSVSQENLSGEKKKRKRIQEQHSTNLVNPETNDLQGSNGDIAPDSESKISMPSKDELLTNDTVTKTDMPQHVPNSSSQISSAKVLTKKLLILDLNGLLADIVPHTNNIRKHDLVLSKKYVYKRPYVDEFLEFCLERFTVAVWSSRKKWNIDPLVKFLIGTDRRRKLLFCWDQYHCTKTTFSTIDGIKKPLVLKDLRKVWDNSLKDPKWVLYNESNTLLLDDSPYKALINPANTAIFPHSYSYTQVDDNALGPGGDLQIYLEGLCLAENVQEYVRNNPFGQPAITQSHPSWNFYQAVKDKYGHPLKKELANKLYWMEAEP